MEKETFTEIGALRGINVELTESPDEQGSLNWKPPDWIDVEASFKPAEWKIVPKIGTEVEIIVDGETVGFGRITGVNEDGSLQVIVGGK